MSIELDPKRIRNRTRKLLFRRRHEQTPSGLSVVTREPISTPDMLRIKEERTQANESKSPGQIRILQWNALHNSTPEQIADTITRIELEHGPIHIICMQEVPVGIKDLMKKKEDQEDETEADKKARRIAKLLDTTDMLFTSQSWMNYNMFDKKDKEKPPGERTVCNGIAIFSRYPFVEDSQIINKLSEGKGGLDYYKNRHGYSLLLTGQIQIPGRDEPFRIGTAHLSISTENPFKRLREVKRAADILEDLDAAFMDANGDPRFPFVRTLFRAMPRCDDGTAKPTYEDTFGPFIIKRRLDYGLAMPEINIRFIEIVKDKGSSDHNPMLYVMNV